VFKVTPSAYRKVDDTCKIRGWELGIENTAVQEGGEREWGRGGGIEDEVKNINITELKVTERERTQVTFTESTPPSVSTIAGAKKVVNNVLEEVSEEESEEYVNGRPMTTKERKKAGRKSKKAARREREKEEVMKARVEKEMERRREREVRIKMREGGEGSGGMKGDDGEATIRTTTEAGMKERISCNTCGGSFKDKAAHRNHFKSEWHRYNLKLKAQGVAVVEEDEFKKEINNDALFFN